MDDDIENRHRSKMLAIYIICSSLIPLKFDQATAISRTMDIVTGHSTQSSQPLTQSTRIKSTKAVMKMKKITIDDRLTVAHEIDVIVKASLSPESLHSFKDQLPYLVSFLEKLLLYSAPSKVNFLRHKIIEVRINYFIGKLCKLVLVKRNSRINRKLKTKIKNNCTRGNAAAA